MTPRPTNATRMLFPLIEFAASVRFLDSGGNAQAAPGPRANSALTDGGPKTYRCLVLLVIFAKRPMIPDRKGHIAGLQERLQPSIVVMCVNGWPPFAQDVSQDCW